MRIIQDLRVSLLLLLGSCYCVLTQLLFLCLFTSTIVFQYRLCLFFTLSVEFSLHHQLLLVYRVYKKI